MNDWQKAASIHLAVRGPPRDGGRGWGPCAAPGIWPVLSPHDSLCGLSMTCSIQGLSLLAPQDASGPSFKAHMTFSFLFFFTHGFFNVDS